MQAQEVRIIPPGLTAVANVPHPIRRRHFSQFYKTFLTLCSFQFLHAQAAVPSVRLIDLSLEELGNIQIISVSKRSESLATAPANGHFDAQEL